MEDSCRQSATAQPESQPLIHFNGVTCPWASLRPGFFGVDLQRLQRGKRMILRIGGFDQRFKNRIGLARIGIDREIQRIGGEPAEIDDAVLDRLRRIRRLLVAVARPRRPASAICGICPAARRSGRSARRYRFPSDPASPRRSARPARARARRRESGRRSSASRRARPAPRELRAGRRPRRSHRAYGLIGFDVAMQSGLRDLRDRNGDAPGVGLCLSCHSCSLLRARIIRHRKLATTAHQRRLVQPGQTRPSPPRHRPRAAAPFRYSRRSGHSCTAPAPAPRGRRSSARS